MQENEQTKSPNQHLNPRFRIRNGHVHEANRTEQSSVTCRSRVLSIAMLVSNPAAQTAADLMIGRYWNAIDILHPQGKKSPAETGCS